MAKRKDIGDKYPIVAREYKPVIRKIPKEKIQWLISQYKQGARVKDLAAECNCGRQYMRYVLAKNGVESRSSRKSSRKTTRNGMAALGVVRDML